MKEKKTMKNKLRSLFEEIEELEDRLKKNQEAARAGSNERLNSRERQNRCRSQDNL